MPVFKGAELVVLPIAGRGIKVVLQRRCTVLKSGSVGARPLASCLQRMLVTVGEHSGPLRLS